MARAKNWNACLEHVRFARLDPSRLLRLLRKTFLMFTQEKGWCRKSSANALGLYFFFCCCFGNFNCYFVFFFCVSRACLQASTYQSVTWSSRIIVASQAPAVPKSLINIPKRLSTLVPPPRELASCCWYENHSFHPLLFGNVSILQKSINYCHQNTLSLQWLKYNSRPSRSSKFLSNHHEYWVTWHSNSGKKLDFSNEKWDIYFRYHQAIIFKNESNEGVVPFVENGTQKRRRTSNMHRHGQVPFNVPTFFIGALFSNSSFYIPRPLI